MSMFHNVSVAIMRRLKLSGITSLSLISLLKHEFASIMEG